MERGILDRAGDGDTEVYDPDDMRADDCPDGIKRVFPITLTRSEKDGEHEYSVPVRALIECDRCSVHADFVNEDGILAIQIPESKRGFLRVLIYPDGTMLSWQDAEELPVVQGWPGVFLPGNQVNIWVEFKCGGQHEDYREYLSIDVDPRIEGYGVGGSHFIEPGIRWLARFPGGGMACNSGQRLGLGEVDQWLREGRSFDFTVPPGPGEGAGPGLPNDILKMFPQLAAAGVRDNVDKCVGGALDF